MPRSRSLSAKTALITVRLEPKYRFALSLLARVRRRPMASVVEMLIDQAMKDHNSGLFEAVTSKRATEYRSILDETWDPEQADRFVNLATKYARFLTYDEERAWKDIKENAAFWDDGRKLKLQDLRHRWPWFKKEYNLDI